MTDREILTELRGARQITFFTRDAGFYQRSLCHPAYCLVVIAAPAEQLASYATRLLRHRAFRTHALRMAKAAAQRHRLLGTKQKCGVV
jgi:hypothetical protein